MKIKTSELIGESALKVCNELDEVALALPMDYLDPPDGGNVSLGVQVARMKAHRDELRAENARLRDYVGDGLLRSDFKSAQEMRVEIKRLHEEVLRLRMYAPGQHQAHGVKTIPRIGPTDWAFYGMEEPQQ